MPASSSCICGMDKEKQEKNKIEGTPILKLAMVKRLKVKKIFRKIKIRKNSSKKFKNSGIVLTQPECYLLQIGWN